MKKTVIYSDQAPEPLGPYSQAVMVEGGRTLYISGQIPLDPATGGLVGEGDIDAQTGRVLDSIGAVLAAAGMDFTNIVKCGIFLDDFNDFAAVNAVYGARFGEAPPARATVEVARLPKDVLIEIDAIAVG